MAVDVLSVIEYEDGYKPLSNFIFDVSIAHLSDGAVAVDCVADHTDGQVGFRALVSRDGWKPHEVEDYTFYWGEIEMYSRGESSDRLLHLFESFYGQPKSTAVFVKSLTCTAVMLEGKPETLETAPTRTKLFFNEKGTQETDYAEVFFDFDLIDGYVVLAEKDEEYRVPLVAALRDGAGGLIGPLQ